MLSNKLDGNMLPNILLALRDHFLTAGWYLLLTGCIDSIINLMATRIGTFGWRDHGATDYGGQVQYSSQVFVNFTERW